MTKKITNDEYQSLALRYNEQRNINDSLERENNELKQIIDEVKPIIQEMTGQLIRDGELIASLQKSETADEYNERNRIS